MVYYVISVYTDVSHYPVTLNYVEDVLFKSKEKACEYIELYTIPRLLEEFGLTGYSKISDVSYIMGGREEQGIMIDLEEINKIIE